MRSDHWTPRLTLPLFLFMVGLGCVGLALIEVQRSVSNTQAVQRELTGYANFAAWSYSEHLRTELRQSAQEILSPVNMLHTSPPYPHAHELGDMIHWDQECPCHIPRYGPIPSYLYQFRLGSDTLDIAPNQAPEGVTGWLSDPVGRPIGRLPAAAQRWLLDTLTLMARLPRSPGGYQLAVAQRGDSTFFLSLTRMPTTWGDTIIYAVQYPSATMSGLLGDVLDDKGLLPPVLSRLGNRNVLAAQVLDAEGRSLFESNIPSSWRFDARARLPAALAGLSVRVEIQPSVASQIIIGGTPRSHLPQLLGLLALAAALTVIAVFQLRREARFAHERAAYVASVSHELRTPLTQIRLATDTLLLRREPDADRRYATLGMIDRQVTHLQHLVDRVLRFSRGERVADPEPLATTDAVAEANRVVEEFALLARQRGVTLSFSSAGSPNVRLTADDLDQVLLNLLDNALKYGPDGQTIAVRVAATPNELVRITVTDQGPGVPAAERERIWRPFERGRAAAARATGGSGIGLTVVRDIALRHGGGVTVEDTEQGGARFVIDLPAAH